MKDIHEVLRRKQARYAELAKQIEMLQQAAEKLREVAPLLTENDDDDSAILAEVDSALLALRGKSALLVRWTQRLLTRPGLRTCDQQLGARHTDAGHRPARSTPR